MDILNICQFCVVAQHLKSTLVTGRVTHLVAESFSRRILALSPPSLQLGHRHWLRQALPRLEFENTDTKYCSDLPPRPLQGRGTVM